MWRSLSDLPAKGEAGFAHGGNVRQGGGWSWRRLESYRTGKDPKLVRKASYTYEKPGTYRVLVKVVDIFGNDTTRPLEVNIP